MELHHQFRITALVLTVFVGFIRCQNENEPKDFAAFADQAAECSNYEITFGSSRDFYTCCPERSSTPPTEPPCKQKLEAVPNFQCKNTEHVQKKEAIREFNCGGKTGQMNAQKRCNRRWAWLEQEADNADCILWSKCFEGACQAERKQQGSSVSGDFCGDGVCELATENSTNCPLDCCPQVNPEQCQIANNTCPEACCGEAYCCKPPTDQSSSAVPPLLLWIILGVVGGIILLNICCCICCVCCAKRCCKRHKKAKFDERHPPENPDIRRLKKFKKQHSAPV